MGRMILKNAGKMLVGIGVVIALGFPANSAMGAQGVTDSEILIGSCAALEGPAGFLGTQVIQGATAYINHINDNGGVYGRKIRLLSYNDSYEPARAIECFNKLKKEGIFAAGFFVGTQTGVKYARMAESGKIPSVGFITGAQFLHYPYKRYIVGVRASFYDETWEQVNHLWNVLGVRKIGVIYQDDAFGVAVLEGIKVALKKHDSSPVAIGSFRRNTKDVDRSIEQVRSSNPEAVIMVGPYEPLAEIVRRGKDGGWNPRYLTVSFVGTEAFIKAAGKYANGTIITQVVPPYNKIDLPAVALYNKSLKKYFPQAQPNFISLEGFVDAIVFVEGLKRAGQDLTREGLIEAFESIQDLDLGLGPQVRLSYAPEDHKGLDAVYYTVVKGEQAVPFADWNDLKH